MSKRSSGRFIATYTRKISQITGLTYNDGQRLAPTMTEKPMLAQITAEQPDTPDAITLIQELEEILNPHYPQESRHGFSVEQLLREEVAFFVMRQGGVPAGYGRPILWAGLCV